MGVPFLGGPFDGGQDAFTQPGEDPAALELIVSGTPDGGDKRMGVYQFDRRRWAWVFDPTQTDLVRHMRRQGHFDWRARRNAEDVDPA